MRGKKGWSSFDAARMQAGDFWSIVSPEPNSGCWLWEGPVNEKGYGHISLGPKTPEKAHRLFYRRFIGPIPADLHVLHNCDTRCCVNPDHLRLGTHQDNMLDMIVKGRQAKGSANGRYKHGLFTKKIESVRARS